jgi:hypothetical protein
MYLPDQPPRKRAQPSQPKAANSPMFAEASPQPVNEPSAVGLNMVERAIKRLFDLASVVVILALFWWAIIVVAIAVRLTTGSPIIYGHKRIGRDGREFKCYKFRSMVPNADEVLAHLLANDDKRGSARGMEPGFQAERRPAHHARRALHPQDQHGRVSAAVERVDERHEHRGAAAGGEEGTGSVLHG